MQVLWKRQLSIIRSPDFGVGPLGSNLGLATSLFGLLQQAGSRLCAAASSSLKWV